MTKQNLFCGILFCISVTALIIACLAFTKKGGGGEYYKEYATCASAKSWCPSMCAAAILGVDGRKGGGAAMGCGGGGMGAGTYAGCGTGPCAGVCGAQTFNASGDIHCLPCGGDSGSPCATKQPYGYTCTNTTQTEDDSDAKVLK